MSGGRVWDNSLLGRVARKLGTGVCLLARGSVTRQMGLRARKAGGQVLSGSKLAGWVAREGHLAVSAGASRLFGLQDQLFQRMPKAAGRLFGSLPCISEPGLAARAIGWLISQLHVLTALFLSAVLLVPHAGWNNLYSTIGVGALFALLLVREASQEGPQVHARRTGGYFFLYMLFQLLAALTSLYPGLSVRFLAFHGTNYLLVVLLVSCFRSLDELVTAVELMGCAISASALYGVYQGVRGVPVKAAEMDTNLNSTGVGRVFGFYDNPNNFAEILILFLPFLAALFFASTGWKRRVFYLLASLPPLLALVMTQSRSSWGGLLVAMLVFAAFLDWRLIPLAGLAGVAVFPFLPLFLRQRVLSIFNSADTSAGFRTKIWQTMTPVIRDFWWTGIGLGNDVVMKISARYPLYTPTVPLHCHNVFLQTWVETGILGLLSLIGFLGSVSKRAIKGILSLAKGTDKCADPHARLFMMAGLSSLAGISIASLVEYTWFYPRVMLFFWVVAGLLLSVLALSEARMEQGRESGR